MTTPIDQVRPIAEVQPVARRAEDPRGAGAPVDWGPAADVSLSPEAEAWLGGGVPPAPRGGAEVYNARGEAGRLEGRRPTGTPAAGGADEPPTGAARAATGASSLSAEEQQQVAELRQRDTEVRAHEAAHMAAGGGLTQGASYSYQTGPDGKRYAVGGEVGIDTSSGSTPEETITRAQQIRAAALAPAEPSAQDRAVASMASRMEAAARRQQAEAVTAEMKASEPASPQQGAGASADGGADGSALGGAAGRPVGSADGGADGSALGGAAGRPVGSADGGADGSADGGAVASADAVRPPPAPSAGTEPDAESTARAALKASRR